MPILTLLIWLGLLGLVAWGITSFIPMPPQIKKVIVGTAIVIAVLILLRAFGLLPGSLGYVPQLGSG